MSFNLKYKINLKFKGNCLIPKFWSIQMKQAGLVKENSTIWIRYQKLSIVIKRMMEIQFNPVKITS